MVELDEEKTDAEEEDEIVQVACGAAHTVLLTKNGHIWVTGASASLSPSLSRSPRAAARRRRGLSASDLLTSRSLADDDGQLGLGDTTSRWTWVRNVAVEEAVRRTGCRRVDRVVCSRASTYFMCS